MALNTVKMHIIDSFIELKPKKNVKLVFSVSLIYTTGGCSGRDRMVVGFTTTCAISTYHH